VLSEKRRSIIQLSFFHAGAAVSHAVATQLFSSDTNVLPKDAFKGKVIMIDLSVQEYRWARTIIQTDYAQVLAGSLLCNRPARIIREGL
jgi:hypothetical protein